MMSLDRMATVIRRRQGIAVREKVIRFRGLTVIFRYNQDGYDIFIDGDKKSSVKTKDIHEAVRLYKTSLSGA